MKALQAVLDAKLSSDAEAEAEVEQCAADQAVSVVFCVWRSPSEAAHTQ